MESAKKDRTHGGECGQSMGAYLAWKNDLAKAGKTPEQMIEAVRNAGLTDYADQVEDLVRKMEAQL